MRHGFPEARQRGCRCVACHRPRTGAHSWGVGLPRYRTRCSSGAPPACGACRELRGLSHRRKPSAPVSHGTFDMDEYGGLYRRLEKETWPSTMRLVAVGPIGDEFREAVEASVVKVLGWDPVDIEVEKRSRWQSIRMKVRCITPDDFCALHSYLKTVDGVKSVL
eukprot:TRINITY_DN25424_c0_g1_i2.p1 TRINITY_DN25424_c0_g1~~TRINITY_DN25424_c0_g1_i2.p1  ORF type:complete len:164 (-),score=21.01 TRINITY_DN25424_c0_g1_i2:50-541(-)